MSSGNEIDSDESLRIALDGMLDEYMRLDPVDQQKQEMLNENDNFSTQNTGSCAVVSDDGTCVSDGRGSTPSVENLHVAALTEPLSQPGVPRSTVLDGSADTFTALVADIVNGGAVSACGAQQERSLELARRISKDLNRCNAQLSHEFPLVQQDVMKCLNLVDRIHKDMLETELSISRTKKLLNIDSLHGLIPAGR